MTAALASPHAKASGAYYTAVGVAEFLAEWAVRAADDRVLDPSFGGGIFLDAAGRRLTDLGGDPAAGVFGSELDPKVHAAVLARVGHVLPPRNLKLGDFFAPGNAHDRGGFDAVIGNPPFVRYQSFSGDARDAAQARASEAGVELGGLCSSWAAFTVHAATRLRLGGRLGFVLPYELFHATYALPVLRFLFGSFRRVDVVTFRRRLFPELSQDCVLVLADGHRRPSDAAAPTDLRHHDLAGPDALRGFDPSRKGSRLPAADLASGRRRLLSWFLPAAAREAYARLSDAADEREDAPARRLGSLARAGIGYVSGNNGFFHLSHAEAEERGLPPSCLLPAVLKGRAFRGLRLTAADLADAEARGDAGLLFHTPGGLAGAAHADHPAVRAYLAEGEAAGVHLAYKCRTREPWAAVPVTDPPDALLTYMTGGTPRLVANDAGAVAPNNLHLVRLRPAARAAGWTATGLAARWLSSLTALSAELEGHALGGGMLKLEPREAGRVLVVDGGEAADRFDFGVLDAAVRGGSGAPAVDATLLPAAGLGPDEAAAITEGAVALRTRRIAAGRCVS